jgi:hypothetical protein
MACLGVAMNACTIAFSSPYFEAQYLSYFETDVGKWAGRLGFILVFEHTVFIVYWIVKCLMPSVPRKVSEALKRHDFVEKMVRGDKEDEETPIQVPMHHVCCF